MNLPHPIVTGLVWTCTGVTIANAQSAAATVRAECSGRSGSQIAIRWGYPRYDGQALMPLTTVQCGTGTRTVQLQVLASPSEIELQTEGGIETAYTVQVTVDGPAPGQSGILTLSHQGSPSVVTRGEGIALRRSSGPNRFGEQNFRVSLSAANAAVAHIVAQSTGTRSDAQFAMRWGHPDFHDNEFFPTWTVRAGAAEEKRFHLTASQSEFEIQTEGGEGTGYHISGWLDLGQGMGMQPSFEISHKLSGIDFSSATGGGTTFRSSAGTATGEGKVSVTVPGLPEQPTAPPPPLLFRLAGPEGGAFAGIFGGGGRGRITQLQNESMVPIEVVGDGHSASECFTGTAGTKALGVHQATTDAEFAALFPQGLPYPVRLVACARLDGSVPNVAVVLLVTYVPTP